MCLPPSWFAVAPDRPRASWPWAGASLARRTRPAQGGSPADMSRGLTPPDPRRILAGGWVCSGARMPERAATCAGCGCGCDDIEVAVAAGGLGRLIHTCRVGDEWFAERTADPPPPARVDGREVDISAAVEAAA